MKLNRAMQHQSRTQTRMRMSCLMLALTFITAVATPDAHATNVKVAQYSTAPHADKISVNLLALQRKAAMQQTTLATVAHTNAVTKTQGTGIVLDIIMNRLDPAIMQKLKLPGVAIRYASIKYRRISAVISNPALLYQLANIPEVRSIRPEYGAMTRVGSVTSRADVALKSDIAKATFSMDGTGQKVGILSDSFACNGNRDANTLPAAGVAGTLTGSPSQDSGDLPVSVQLLSDLSNPPTCTDEGAGMGELVHDIAPGAAMAFATAFGSQAGFAQGITKLCSAPVNATVVVDDVAFFAEPMYQDGIIAQAAAACVASGVPYYSSAGNSANRAFRQTFTDINPVDDQAVPPTGNDLHRWRTTTATIRDGFIAVTLQPNEKFTAVLQWNQPFDSISAGNGSQIDMDLYIAPTPDVAGFQPANLLAVSLGNQGTTGAPAGDAVEIAGYTNTTGAVRTVYVAVDHFKGSQTTIPQNAATPVELRLVFFGGGTIEGITNATSAFGGPTVYGHNMATGVSSVAAVPWFDTALFNPNFTPTIATDPEPFTARGGTLTVQFNTAGAYAPRSSFEPDISSVDGNNTRFFGSALNLGGAFGEPDAFPNFFGTSAAAPNAAAVASLIRQRNSSRTPAQVNMALESTAIDITGARAATGDDDVSGIGLIDANAAITSVPASADLAITNTDSPDPVTAGNNLTYTIRVTNNGPTSPATGVVLTDTIDAGVTFISATPSQGAACTRAGVTVTCNLGNVTTATPATVTVVVNPNAAGGINNSATVAGAEPDPVAANNSAAQATVVNAPPTPPAVASGGGGGCTLGHTGRLDPVLPVLMLLSMLTLWRRKRS